MTTSVERRFECAVIRYMPDLVRGESVNIGVLLTEERWQGSGYADIRFTKNWRRVRCVHPAADLEVLQALEEDLRNLLRGPGGEVVLSKLDRYCSNTLQFGVHFHVTTAQPEKEIERLLRRYVEAPLVERAESMGRARVRNLMQQEFERANVWGLMAHDISVSRYTQKGNPFKLDCGYQHEGAMKFFHALALKSDVSAATLLAYTFPRIETGVAREQRLMTTMTAVVDTLDREQETIGFALDTLEDAHIEVSHVSDVSMIAQRIRQELRA